jgi:CCR4-NOT transcription complex subunit 6
VKTVQVGVLLEEIEALTKKTLKSKDDSSLKNLPILICGDFNSQINSAVYELMSKGYCKEHQDLNGRDYGDFTEQGFKHNLNLRSAYDNVGELPFTNFTPSFTDVLDYIWYTPGNLSVSGLLGKVDDEYLGHYIGFPNVHCPSDHVPLLTRFQLKQHNKKEAIRKDIKPEFRSSRKT